MPFYLLARVLIAFFLLSLSAELFAAQRLIIQLDENHRFAGSSLSEAELTAIIDIARSGIGSVRSISGGYQIVEFEQRFSEDELKRIAEQVSRLNGVDSAEPDRRYRPQLLVNDPDYNRQWYLTNESGGINATDAWDFTIGSSETVIAVLDTGVLTHSDYVGRILPGYDFISDVFTANDGDGRDSNPSDPGDAVNQDECELGEPEEDQPSSWHGTLIAGIVAANSNNNTGIAGIDHQANILPVRVLGKCGGYSSDIADAIRWAAGISDDALPETNPNPASIINLSFGSEGVCTAVEQAAIDEAVAAGVLIVAAAGNAHIDVENYAPANCNSVLVVAASTRDGGESCYTNYGEKISISAPGGNRSVGGGCLGGSANGIYSTSNNGLSTPGGETLESVAGTSFAAPMVSGVAGLIKAVNPILTPADIRFIFESSARDFPVGTTDSFADCEQSRCGYGLLDAYESVLTTRRDALIMEGDGTIRMSVSEACVTEDDQAIALSITRIGGLGAVAARVVTERISATSGRDFGALDQLIAWGESEVGNRELTIPIFSDSIIEGSEFFNVSILEKSSNAQIGAPAATTVTIVSTNGTTPKTCVTPDPATRPTPAPPTSVSSGGGAMPFIGLMGLMLGVCRKNKLCR